MRLRAGPAEHLRGDMDRLLHLAFALISDRLFQVAVTRLAAIENFPVAVGRRCFSAVYEGSRADSWDAHFAEVWTAAVL